MNPLCPSHPLPPLLPIKPLPHPTKQRKNQLTILNNPQIPLLPTDDLLQIPQILPQLFDLPSIELLSRVRCFLNVEACADVDEDGGGGGERAGDVEGGG